MPIQNVSSTPKNQTGVTHDFPISPMVPGAKRYSGYTEKEAQYLDSLHDLIIHEAVLGGNGRDATAAEQVEFRKLLTQNPRQFVNGGDSAGFLPTKKQVFVLIGDTLKIINYPQDFVVQVFNPSPQKWEKATDEQQRIFNIAASENPRQLVSAPGTGVVTGTFDGVTFLVKGAALFVRTLP